MLIFVGFFSVDNHNLNHKYYTNNKINVYDFNERNLHFPPSSLDIIVHHFGYNLIKIFLTWS